MHEVCDDLGLPEHGRQTKLAALLKVSQQAVGKWLSGETYPEMPRALALADRAGVNVAWLLQGVGPKRGTKVDTKVLELGEALSEMPGDERQMVLDFIEYRISKSQLFTGERLSRYMTMLDAFKRKPS
jgi:transcriptional regulator with XRE-family HTH domain